MLTLPLPVKKVSLVGETFPSLVRLDSMTSTEAPPIPDVSNLPRDIDLLIPMIVQVADELTRERETRRFLQHEFDLLLKRLWGPKSEKVAAGQMALFDGSSPRHAVESDCGS